MPALVSCVLPTRNRPHLLGQAIWYFLRQDYPDTELIVLDDSEVSSAGLIVADPRVRYVHLAAPAPIARLRALGVELARGEMIAHWDDDDWAGPERISRQVAALTDADADLCRLDAVLHYVLDRGQAWQPRSAHLGSPGTFLYRRSVAANPAGLPPERVVALHDPAFFVTVVHPGSTTARNFADPAWQRRPVAEVDRRLGPDRDFYVALRHGPAARIAPAPASITFAATFAVYDGYGSMAEYAALGMARAGARVDVEPFRLDPAGLREETRALIAAARPAAGAPVLAMAWWGESLHRYRAVDDLFVNTMWETSRLPADWPPRLNRARAVIVPTTFVAKTFRASGVTVPVEVVPQGVDPEVYHHEDRPERCGLTTLMLGVYVPRKNVDEGIAAWKLAFADDPHARLIIKARFGWRAYAPDDPRITFIDAAEPTRGVAHWYREADVLMALGNEGFGLPLVEGMATGLPVIALDSEGQADVCAEARGLLLPVPPARWQPFDEPPFGPCGVRGVPAVEDVAERLRWVRDDRDAAREMGRAASAWALLHRNVWAMGPALLDVVERHLGRPRPLRLERVVWAPGGDAGVEALAATAVAATRVQTTPHPNLARARLLHVIQAPGRADDTTVAGAVQQARASGIPVAVTVHAAGTRVAAWERDADVLVATSATDAAMLAARWPSKRVETIARPNATAYANLWRSLDGGG